MNNFIKVVIIAICVTALLTGLTYVAIKTYEFIIRETSTDFENNQGYDYSQDMQSIDGCIVIKYNEIISEDKNALDSFVEACNNGEDGFIRIYYYNIIVNATVIDVERKGEKINIAAWNVTQEGAYIGYNSGNEIIIINNSYILRDEIGNQTIICRIEKIGDYYNGD